MLNRTAFLYMPELSFSGLLEEVGEESRRRMVEEIMRRQTIRCLLVVFPESLDFSRHEY